MQSGTFYHNLDKPEKSARLASVQGQGLGVTPRVRGRPPAITPPRRPHRALAGCLPPVGALPAAPAGGRSGLRTGPVWSRLPAGRLPCLWWASAPRCWVPSRSGAAAWKMPLVLQSCTNLGDGAGLSSELLSVGRSARATVHQPRGRLCSQDWLDPPVTPPPPKVAAVMKPASGAGPAGPRLGQT